MGRTLGVIRSTEPFESILQSMKKASAALKRADEAIQKSRQRAARRRKVRLRRVDHLKLPTCHVRTSLPAGRRPACQGPVRVSARALRVWSESVCGRPVCRHKSGR